MLITNHAKQRATDRFGFTAEDFKSIEHKAATPVNAEIIMRDKHSEALKLKHNGIQFIVMVKRGAIVTFLDSESGVYTAVEKKLREHIMAQNKKLRRHEEELFRIKLRNKNLLCESISEAMMNLIDLREKARV